MKPFVTIILAAGKGTRMKSDLPKVLHPVGGKPMLLHVVGLAQAIGSQRIISIIGHKKIFVIEALRPTGTEWAIQAQQLGTGHAVQQTADMLSGFDGDLLILSGDVPLLKPETIHGLLQKHRSTRAGATLLTAIFDDPSGYGRIIRNSDGSLKAIVEHKDCTPNQLTIHEINAGIYVMDAQVCFKALTMINNDNSQGEYYLPDVLQYFPDMGKTVALEIVRDHNEISGVNTPQQLAELNRIFQAHHEK